MPFRYFASRQLHQDLRHPYQYKRPAKVPRCPEQQLSTNSFSLSWIASESLFCAFWIRNTIKKVTIVVPVLITSCQFSENLKKGYVTAQRSIRAQAVKNAGVPPVIWVTFVDNLSKKCCCLAAIKTLKKECFCSNWNF